MTQTNTYPPEIKFCVKYLNERGYKSVDFPCILQSIKAEDPDYNLVKKQTEQYFIDLAELTWDDIRQLFVIADNYESELNRPKYLSEGYCKEVLHRFLESKKEVEL